MHLATRCPFCETVFRLQPAHLALRRGLVRCGHCNEVFDASSSLYEIEDGADFSTAAPLSAEAATALTSGRGVSASSGAASGTNAEGGQNAGTGDNPAQYWPSFGRDAWDPWAPPPDAAIDNRLLHNANNLPLTPVAAGVAVTPRHAYEPSAPHAAVNEAAATHDEPVFSGTTDAHADNKTPPVWRPNTRAVDDEPDLQDAQAAAATLRTTPDSEPHFGTTEAAPAAAAASPFAAHPPEDDTDPFAVVRETRAPPPSRIGWKIFGSLVALILFVVLLAQLAWWQRETIMVYWPGSQPLYAQACEQFNCDVTPPHDIDGLQVEPSDLRQIDGPHKLELKMPLRNRYNVALAYPAIELTLLDSQNNVAVRRVLFPQDYVKPGTPIAAGLPARTTQTMIVHLDTGDAIASNFRVQIFYP
ncbi:zinc-ribbon and DUF3426 domain-containing protein [Paraburkholderia sp. DHOC27]|uniref:zinc-ribbon and DUF3426 domain-containing protein n=1 Tax=Paraburkholderia sp. DHOC27 TaxID=2303330 RepID=UPI000E3D497F|nr:zinc-ribbon and DUF3426 domain-containing protein [Paraburkholderia sp. DHOC27]RFU45768.1 DUF3426 domain-containing protein [Paraburkholderia sp. DHOC27]